MGILLCGLSACSNVDPPDRTPPRSAGPTSAAAAKPSAATTPAAKLAWPRTFTDGDRSFSLYQPQITTWEGDQLAARSAVVVNSKGAKEPRYGVVWLEARTAVDKPARVVTLTDVKVTKATFPQAAASEGAYLESIRKHIGNASRVVSLDQMEANFAASGSARAAAVEVKNDPPKILFATKPTLLVLIDGQPVLRDFADAQGVKLKRVVNTRPLVVQDEATGRYYLHAMRSWLAAPALEGPWGAAKEVPAAVQRLAEVLKDDKSVDLLDPQAEGAAPAELPAVVISTKPAELIQTAGEPKYEPIPGTDLSFISNTDSAVFRHQKTQQSYVLVSGRWFVAPSLEGPWAHLPGKDLPPDFKNIPPDGPRANVLVSVPGTPESREALIANSIPQTATVKISEAKLTLVFDGPPQFKPVDGASGLSYATNTTLPVIRIDGDQTCWCVDNGVWFSARAPTGPWAVATSVPAIIYTIPPSSPLHYVTYVRVYGSGPDVVYVGYTPGYFGTVASSEGVVVYGTGYAYPAYVGTVYVGYPPTYGYGAGFAYGSMSGFAFGFTAGAMIGGCWSQPYWGPCYGGGYGHIDINSSSVYHGRHGGSAAVNRHYEYDPWTGKSKASGSFSSFNPYSNRASVGGYEAKFNDQNNEFKGKRGGATYDADTGVARAAGSKVGADLDEGVVNVKRGAVKYDENTGVIKGAGSSTHRDYDTGEFTGETGKFRYNTNTDTGIAKKGDDLYVGKDDNVYRRTDEGWQQKTDDGWSSVERDPNRSAQAGELNQQRQSRETGSSRVNSYQGAGAYRSSSNSGRSDYSTGGSRGYSPSRGAGGGGYRGGGGGGRGGGGRR